MIESGWIFPNGTEYACGGDNLIMHDAVVKHFIRGLRFQDLTIQKMISKEIDDWFLEHGSVNLYSDYAICRLGWIKVGTTIWQNITYAGYDWHQDLVNVYEENGYHIQNRYLSSSCFLSLQCNILLAIKNGARHYHSPGKEYRYDGTDENDTYVDEDGRIHIAPWSKITT